MSTHSAGARRGFSRRALGGTLAGGLASLTGATGGSGAQALEGELHIGFEQGHVAEPFISETAETFTGHHPGTELELDAFAPGNYATQLVLQLSSGGGPDIFLFSGAAIAELASSGLVLPIDPWLPTWDSWQYYPDAIRAAISFEGSVWGLPYSVDTHFLFYRRDLFAQAGLPTEWLPEQPDDVLAAARAIGVSVPEVIPYALYAGANGGNGTVVRGFIPLVAAFGGELTDETGRWIIDSCPIRQALSFYETAYQVDEVVPQEVMTGASAVSAMRQAMGRGALGILYDGSWNYRAWSDVSDGAAVENIGFTRFPAGANPPFAIGGIGNCWYINAECRNADLAWEYIGEFNSRKNHVALNLGDPHIPARSDAAADPAFQATPFLQAMVATADTLLLAPPSPAFRDLVPVVQNATGIVASGTASPEEAVERYSSELARILGEQNVVAQPCS